MTLDDNAFEILHAVRLRGVANTAQLAEMTGRTPDDLTPVLDRLAADDLIFERAGRRVSGWTLTETGRETHGERIRAGVAAVVETELPTIYDAFLDHNVPLKTLCSAWQQAGTDEAARWKAIGELEDIHGTAAVVFDRAGAVMPRFGRYRDRLGAALEKVTGGDERFFTGATVDSYHTIWFEAHEDFLLSLGRDRAEEGSF